MTNGCCTSGSRCSTPRSTTTRSRRSAPFRHSTDRRSWRRSRAWSTSRSSRSSGTALARLTTEHPNTRAAFVHSIETGDVTTVFAFISALALFWDDTGYRQDAVGWIRRALDAGPPPANPATVSALVDASFLLQNVDVDHAHRLARMAADLASTCGVREQAIASLVLGYTLAYLDRPDEAIASLRRALEYFGADDHPWERATALAGMVLAAPSVDDAIAAGTDGAALFRRSGDRHRLANTLYGMANRAIVAGARLDEAQVWLDESLRLSHETGSEHDRMHALLGLARLAWRRRDDARAQTQIDECLPVAHRLGDQRCIGRALLVLGDLARQRGDIAAATELLRLSIQAAAPAADRVTLDSARSTLADLVA
jgi:tetratricopeptide (TPR) repeat protein